MTQGTRGPQKAQPKEYTWDDLKAAIGQDFSGGIVRTGADSVERSTIRRFCEPVEMDCPLFYDDEVARKHGYKGVIAPSTSVTTFTSQPIWKPGDPDIWPSADADHWLNRPGTVQEGNVPTLPKPKTTDTFVTDIEMEYLQPVYVGDRLSTRGRKLVSVTTRGTRVGYGAFVVFEGEIFNQRGEVVARTRNGSFMYNAGATGP